MKKLLILLALTLVSTGFLAAQTKSAAETKVFALQLGTGFSYDLATKATNPNQTVAAIFGLSESVQAGFVVIKGDTAAHSFSLLQFSVYPVTDVAVNVLFGGDSSATPKIMSGFGVGYNAFRNASGSLTTALQITTQYLFNDVANGNLGLGVNLKVGL